MVHTWPVVSICIINGPEPLNDINATFKFPSQDKSSCNKKLWFIHNNTCRKKISKIKIYTCMCEIYRITAIMKVNTDIITSITACPIGHHKHFVILQIKTITSVLRPSNEIFKNWCYCFYWQRHMMLHWQIIFSISHHMTLHWQILFSIRVSSLLLTIILGEMKGNMFKLPINMYNYKEQFKKNMIW